MLIQPNELYEFDVLFMTLLHLILFLQNWFIDGGVHPVGLQARTLF